MRRIEVPFLIVGAGPVGLLGGILLAGQERSTLIVERRDGPQRAPAAHVVNARSFEILRQAGVDAAAIANVCQEPSDAGLTIFMTHLSGEEVGRLPFERQDDECLRHTPTPLRNLSQHHLEPILAETFRGYGASELRYGHQWESAEQNADGVTSRIRDLERDEIYEVRSRYLIAADGAGSRVRKSLDIEMEGPPQIETFLMVHFEANLRSMLAGHLGVLYWILDPEIGGTLVAHDIDREWVYMKSFDPEQKPLEYYNEKRCRDLVWRALGKEVPLRIRNRGSWVMSSQLARRMRDHQIFLAGDAAHRFPPTGGLGLNTGLQDIHGLVWKLGAVEDGWANASLLETYETERRPVAASNAEHSLRNAFQMLQLAEALGVAEEPTTARMEATLADPAGRSAVVQAIENQAEHFDMLGLQLGYSYENGALVPDGSEPPVVDNPVREFVASSRPGARLPHAWLDVGGERVSSLDLVRPDALTLFSWREHEPWEQALAGVSGVPVVQVRIDTDALEPDSHWAEVCGIEPGGVLLVRPDHHVAWRRIQASSDAVASLRDAVTGVVNASD